MRAWVVAISIAVTGCGRIGFEPTTGTGDAGQSDSRLSYHGVQPVYITGYAMPPLVPTASGTPTGFAIAPPLPAGMTLDPMTGTISGSPTAVQPTTAHTVTAHDAEGPISTSISIRTAGGYVVNSNADDVDATLGDGVCETAAGNGRCTLRAAVGEVNADGGTTQVIYIPAQTIVLGAILPAVAQSMELVGETTSSAIIDGNSATAILEFGANNVTLALTSLTYRNSSGYIAPHFLMNIGLTVDHVMVTNSGGFANSGTIVLRDSTFSSNTGDVVYSATSTTVDCCTFVGNSNNSFATIYFVGGTGAVTNSTFTGNAGPNSVILINNATVSLAQNTFAANMAGAAFQGGAITQYSGGTSTWTNNVFANNTGQLPTCTMNGTVTGNGGNLVYPLDALCAFLTAADPQAADPLLLPLADNGGPTQTMALGTGSPAIDTGVAAMCTPIDQRGVARPLGAGCDIGAVEQQ